MEASLTLSAIPVNALRIKRHDRFELSEAVGGLEDASVSGILGTKRFQHTGARPFPK